MMAGLKEIMAPGASPAPQPRGGDQSTKGQAEGMEADASPAEQEQYEMIVGNAMTAIYPKEGETVAPSILKALQGSENPMMNLAVAATMLVTSIRDSAAKAGAIQNWDAQAQQSGDLSFDEILFHAGSAIVSELAEVSEAAGLHDYTEEEVEQAFYAGIDMFRSQAEKTGALDTEALKSGWGQIVEADRQGRIGDVLPGIQDRINKAERGPEQPEEQMQ